MVLSPQLPHPSITSQHPHWLRQPLFLLPPPRLPSHTTSDEPLPPVPDSAPQEDRGPCRVDAQRREPRYACPELVAKPHTLAAVREEEPEVGRSPPKRCIHQ